jgi:histidinol-phosphate/aromatic aminotransferase/cobyric acid decarboxylase-like protein
MTFPDPTFSMVRDFARMNGIGAIAVPWPEAEADPGRLLVDAPDLVYICRPNNPTGTAVSRDWIESIMGMGGPDGPLLILDEAYADFASDSFLLDAPDSQRLLVLRTFSKLFGLAGLRVGFAVGPATLVREVEKSRGPYKVGQLASLAASAALRDDSGWLEGIATETRTNRDRLAMELKARGLTPLPSQSNFLLFAVEPADALAVNQALRDRGVAARPFPGLPEIGDALRVTVGPWEAMERFLAALDELLGRDPAEGRVS